VTDADYPATPKRLSDLRDAQSADATLRNLINTVSEKLEFSARLPVLAYEADQEGHVQVAATFRHIATGEARSLAELLDTLKLHLERTQAAVPTETAS
jgi:hypothetical protein